ncbi:unnamed protein product [Ectocarpus sp. 4 AP-2014]
MRLSLLLSFIAAASSLRRSSGFMFAAAGARSGSCSNRNGVPCTTHACKGPSRTATPATARRGRSHASSSMRMGETAGEEGLEADGGSSDGTALAEARIVVQGQSTGGYFRAHARNEAHFNRKLCGALKELGQGQTEIIVEGKTSAIRSFLRWCKRGPGLSQQIQEVTVHWAEYTGIFDGFEVFPDETSHNTAAAGVP